MILCRAMMILCGAIRFLCGAMIFCDESAKFVRQIKFVAEDKPGFWEVRGYSNTAGPWRLEIVSRSQVESSRRFHRQPYQRLR